MRALVLTRRRSQTLRLLFVPRPKTKWTLQSRVLPDAELGRLRELHNWESGVALGDHGFADVFSLNEDGADFSFVAAAAASDHCRRPYLFLSNLISESLMSDISVVANCQISVGSTLT